ncbi:hypothetical protein HRI_004163600 [Hibiscus trionum]|uniref:Formin-like protein n=1 Tax=Hibiscus trionum TaxID=183268 RepID=A0A9W7MK39_HIBTR|nr:hypothetical protein HRI_004163600 [Hibiscus trionum]
MALFRRLFYRKPPDRLLEISENVYVFDCCFTADVMEEDDFKVYMDSIVAQLQDYFPEASFMVFNFREGDKRSQISDILTEYNMTVTDYPRQYGGCPLLPLEMIHQFFQSSERWLSSEGQQNVLLLHCERGGWPVLAFMLAGLLLYRKQYSGEQKTLEMLYKQAPRDLLKLLSPLNPQPSHLRYLHYISRRNLSTDWPPADTPRFLNYIILRVLPPLEGRDGCRPVIHVYGMDPKTPANRSCKLLFSTSKSKKQVPYFQKEECALVKIDTHCHIQGDVVLECVHLNEDLVHEEMIFRIMFHTAFVRRNILIFNHNEVDVLWDVRDQFPKEFSAEVNFMDPDAVVPRLTRVTTSEVGNEIESGTPDEFFEVEEIFSNAVDKLDGKVDDDSLAVHNNKLEQKDVRREDIDPHRFHQCAKNDGNKKQDVKVDSSIYVVKDIAVDDVKYKLHKKMDSDTNAVKDIAVDEGDIKVGSVEFTIDALRDRETKVVTDDVLGKLEDVDNSVNREDTVPLKRQRVATDISRLKPEKLPPASKKWGGLLPKPASESCLVKPKSKQLEPHGHPARQAKPNAISRWIPPNKGSFANSMHVSYPPSRHGSVPLALSGTMNLRKSKSGSNLKVSAGAALSKDVLFRQKSLNVFNTKPLKDVSFEQKGQKVDHVKASDSPKEIFTTPRTISVFEQKGQKVDHVKASDSPKEIFTTPRTISVFEQKGQKVDHVKASDSPKEIFTTPRTINVLPGLEQSVYIPPNTPQRSPPAAPLPSPPAPPPSPPAPRSSLLDSQSLQENTTSILLSLPSGDVSRMPFATSPPTSPPCTTANVHNTTTLQENTTSVLPSLPSGDISRMPFATSPPSPPPTSPPCTTANVHNTTSLQENTSILPSLPSGDGSRMPFATSPPSPPPTSPPCTTANVHNTNSLQENTTSILPSLPSGDVSRMPFAASHPSPPPTSLPCTTANVHNIGMVSQSPVAGSPPLPPSPPLSNSQTTTLLLLPPTPSSSWKSRYFSASCTVLHSPPPSPPHLSSIGSLCTSKPGTKHSFHPQSPTTTPIQCAISPPVMHEVPSTPSLPLTPSLCDPPSPAPPSLPPPVPTGHGPLPPPCLPPCLSPLPPPQYRALAPLLPPMPLHQVASSPPPLPPPFLHGAMYGHSPHPLPMSCFSSPPPELHQLISAAPPLPPPPLLMSIAPTPLAPSPLMSSALVPPLVPPPLMSSAPNPSPPPLTSSSLPSPSPSPLSMSGTPLPPSPSPPPSMTSVPPPPQPSSMSSTTPPSPLMSDAPLPPPSPPPSTSSAPPPPPPPSPPSSTISAPPLPPSPLSSTTSAPPQSPSPTSMSKSPIPSPPSPTSLETSAPPAPPPFSPSSLVSSAPSSPPSSMNSAPPSPPSSMTSAAPPPPPPPQSMSSAPPLPPTPPPLMSNTPPPPPPPQLLGVPPPPIHGIAASSSSPMHKAPPPPPPPPGGGAPPPPPPPGGGAPPPPPPPGGQAPGPPAPPGAPGGGPPPPPPGARGRGRGPSRLGAISTTKKSSLKPLHWSKVSRAIKGSLWEELQRHGEPHIAPEFDVSELETLFSAVVPKRAGGGKGKGKSGGSKADKVHLIDLRRANNTEIMLTKVKMPLSDMMAAVLAMDDTVLDVDQVENLIKFCPTKEETELLKNYTGDKENLGKCEQYFLELMKVPRVESKMRVFSFKIQFRTQISEFRRSLETVNSACDEVRNSDKLKEIMKKILYLGNTLNQGTARGSAVGFKLDSLLKLTDTRASTRKMTLMHYLCKALAEKKPELLDFHLEFVSLEAAAKIHLKALAEEMQAIIKGLEKVKQELAASEDDGPVSDVFSKTLKEFVSGAEADAASVTNLHTEVNKNAESLALYFGEDPARCPFEQVTSTLLNFVRLFRKAYEENMKQAEIEQKQAGIEQKQAEMEQKKAEKEGETDKGKGEQESE